MNNQHEQILVDTVARNSPAVLSLPSEGMLRNHKSRFLAWADEGIWLEGAPADSVLIDSLIAAGAPVAVSCKLATQTLRFVSPILRRDAQYALSAERKVEAVLLQLPESLVMQQRRNDYRVRLREDDDLAATVWQIPEHAHISDKPLARAIVPTRLRDISLGGLGLIALPKQGETKARMTLGERLRVELRCAGEQFIVEARVVFADPSQDGSSVKVGLHFQKLENNLEGRQTLAVLTRLLGHLQRGEARRARLAKAG